MNSCAMNEPEIPLIHRSREYLTMSRKNEEEVFTTERKKFITKKEDGRKRYKMWKSSVAMRYGKKIMKNIAAM